MSKFKSNVERLCKAEQVSLKQNHKPLTADVTICSERCVFYGLIRVESLLPFFIAV